MDFFAAGRTGFTDKTGQDISFDPHDATVTDRMGGFTPSGKRFQKDVTVFRRKPNNKTKPVVVTKKDTSGDSDTGQNEILQKYEDKIFGDLRVGGGGIMVLIDVDKTIEEHKQVVDDHIQDTKEAMVDEYEDEIFASLRPDGEVRPHVTKKDQMEERFAEHKKLVDDLIKVKKDALAERETKIKKQEAKIAELEEQNERLESAKGKTGSSEAGTTRGIPPTPRQVKQAQLVSAPPVEAVGGVGGQSKFKNNKDFTDKMKFKRALLTSNVANFTNEARRKYKKHMIARLYGKTEAEIKKKTYKLDSGANLMGGELGDQFYDNDKKLLKKDRQFTFVEQLAYGLLGNMPYFENHDIAELIAISLLLPEDKKKEMIEELEGLKFLTWAPSAFQDPTKFFINMFETGGFASKEQDYNKEKGFRGDVDARDKYVAELGKMSDIILKAANKADGNADGNAEGILVNTNSLNDENFEKLVEWAENHHDTNVITTTKHSVSAENAGNVEVETDVKEEEESDSDDSDDEAGSIASKSTASIDSDDDIQTQQGDPAFLEKQSRTLKSMNELGGMSIDPPARAKRQRGASSNANNVTFPGTFPGNPDASGAVTLASLMWL